MPYISGVRVTKRLPGKLHSVLEKLDHGHHDMRIYRKNLVGCIHEKFSAFLRVEVGVNRMKDLDLNKGLENLERLRRKHGSAGHGRRSQNRRHQDSRYPHDMMRLMEVLRHGGTQLNGWRSADIHPSIQPSSYPPAPTASPNFAMTFAK